MLTEPCSIPHKTCFASALGSGKAIESIHDNGREAWGYYRSINPISNILIFMVSLIALFFTCNIAYPLTSGNNNPDHREAKNNQSLTEDKYIVTQSDLAKFVTIEDDSDIWSWNSEIIRRYQKSTGTRTYFWAPIEYTQLKAKWDSQSRVALYFLDGNRISARQAKACSQDGSGFPVGKSISVGDPRFSLQMSNTLPSIRKKDKKRSLKQGIQKLKDRYGQKYHPEYWQFTALAVTEDFIWAAIRSIPRPPESIPRFLLPNGSLSPRHFRESSVMPIQGGLVRIEKDTGEYVRFTEKNGLPDRLICRPFSGGYSDLPHFLPHIRFPQEIVAITQLEDGRIRFTTRSSQQVFYYPEQGKWENAP